MENRITKAEANGILLLILIGLPILLFIQIGEAVCWPLLITLIVGIVILFMVASSKIKEKRGQHLMEKYQDKEIVDLLVSKSFRVGQRAEQL